MMNFNRFVSSMINSSGEDWTTPEETFRGMLRDNHLLTPLSKTIAAGAVLTRQIDSQGYLVLSTDYADTHLSVAVELIRHAVEVSRKAEGVKDTFGRSAGEYQIVYSSVPVVLQGRFSVSVDIDRDRQVTVSYGTVFLPDTFSVKETDIITFPAKDKFIVRSVNRPVTGLMHLELVSLN